MDLVQGEASGLCSVSDLSRGYPALLSCWAMFVFACMCVGTGGAFVRCGWMHETEKVPQHLSCSKRVAHVLCGNRHNIRAGMLEAGQSPTMARCLDERLQPLGKRDLMFLSDEMQIACDVP